MKLHLYDIPKVNYLCLAATKNLNKYTTEWAKARKKVQFSEATVIASNAKINVFEFFFSNGAVVQKWLAEQNLKKTR